MRDITKFLGNLIQPLQRLSYPPAARNTIASLSEESEFSVIFQEVRHHKTVRMGIKQLFSIIKDEAPEAIKEGEIKNQFGRKVAIVSLQLLPYSDANKWLIDLHRMRT